MFPNYKKAATVTAPPRATGAKGFLINSLPTIGGALGAIGGSFVAPIAGTAAGGAAGSVIGEALKQRLNHENPNSVAMLTQGAMGALPGLAKGIKPGLMAAKATNVGEAGSLFGKFKSAQAELDAAKAAKAASKTGVVTKMSNSMTKGGSGLTVGGHVGDVKKLDEATQTLQRLGIKGTPTAQLKKINDIMASHGAKVDEILNANPVKMSGADVKKQVAAAIKDPTKFAELDLSTKGAQRALDAHLEKFAQAKTAKEVNDYIKVLNPIASKAQDKLARGVSLTDKETAALAAKKAGDESLSSIEGVKPLKKDMAVLFERNPQIAKESEKTAGIPILGIKSRFVKQSLDAGKSTVGNTTAKVVRATDNKGVDFTKNVGKELFKQAGVRAVAAPFAAQSNNEAMNPNNTAANQNNMQTATNPTTTDNMDSLSNTDQQMSSEDSGITGVLDQAILSALSKGDTKGLSNLLAVADYYQKRSTSGAGKPLSTAAAKDISNAQTGLDALNNMTAILQNDPSAQMKSSIPGQGMFGGAGARILGTGEYKAAQQQIVDVIARMRTGATINDQEARLFTRMTPQSFDSPQAVQAKLNYLRKAFTIVADRQNTGSNVDLSQLVAQ